MGRKVLLSVLTVLLTRGAAPAGPLSRDDLRWLKDLARDTYLCLDYYTEPETGLPLDNSRPQEDHYTSVTNIGLYVASLVGAAELGFETRKDAEAKAAKALHSAARLRTWQGFPYSWNHTLRLTPHPEDFISTVDLGNYYGGLIVGRQYFKPLRADFDRLLRAGWKKLYDPGRGLLFGGYHPGEGRYADWHYDHLGTDSRLASFLAVAMSGVPPESWDALDRTLEERHGIEYLKHGWQGGGLFAAFLTGIFIDERGTLPGLSAGNFAKAQMAHMDAIGSSVWGWSASDSPDHGYLGFHALRDDVVAPHASALALSLFPREVVANLRRLDELGVRPRHLVQGRFHDFGFRDAYDLKSGRVTPNYLVLDQAMLFLSLVNFLERGRIQKLFLSYPPVKDAIPLIPEYRGRLRPSFPVELSGRFGLEVRPYDLARPAFRAARTAQSPFLNPDAWRNAGKNRLYTPHSAAQTAGQEPFSTFSVLWDPNFLYVKADIADASAFEGWSRNPTNAGHLIEILTDADDDPKTGQAKTLRLGLAPADPANAHPFAWHGGRELTGSEVRLFSEPAGKGYSVTISIEWGLLGMDRPRKDSRMGFSIAVSDRDSSHLEAFKPDWHFKSEGGRWEIGTLILN